MDGLQKSAALACQQFHPTNEFILALSTDSVHYRDAACLVHEMNGPSTDPHCNASSRASPCAPDIYLLDKDTVPEAGKDEFICC